MAKKGNRIIVKMVNKETGSFYVTTKNRINTTEKMKIKKFDKKTRKHVVFEEGKVK
jgi:large subunit ribosomal protein L33